ncbi:MAG: helix-turn-helix domain-containing protein [Cyclobacteriaceae bacterium]|nr:helix-turn-helix domain-containing protein [Cyclobacteriaceae bacterium]
MSPTFCRNESNIVGDTLLVVSSDDETRQQIQHYLQPLFNVLTATCVDEAYCKALQFIPSLVISHINCIGIGRFRLCEQMKNDPVMNHIPVILLASKADTELKVQSFNTGADDLMALPVHDHELRARVSNIISNRRKLSENVRRQIQNESIMGIKIESLNEKLLKLVTKIVLDNLSDTQFGVNKLAREVGKSNSQLYRELVALTGKSPNDFIRDIRLQYASQLLIKNAGNVGEVASIIGFSNLSYFAKCFKEKFHVAPSAYANYYNKNSKYNFTTEEL